MLLLHLELLLTSLSLDQKILELSVFSLVDGRGPGLVGLPDVLRGCPPLFCDDLCRLGQRNSGRDLLSHLRAEDRVAVSPAPFLESKIVSIFSICW